MKMTDINKNLTEAPDLKGNVKGQPNTLAQRLKQKVKKHTPFSAKKRGEAEYKDQIFKQAQGLKNDFAKHMQNYKPETIPTVAHLEEFFKDTEYEKYVNQVAIDLKFREAEPKAEVKPEPKIDKTNDKEETKDAGLTKVAGDVKGGELELEKEKKPEQSKKEIRAAYKKQGDELEAERIAKGGELDEEEDDDTSSNISASIYESRLRNILFELKDNEVDTIIVRIIQASNRAKGGPSTPATDEIAKQSPRKKEATSDEVSDEESAEASGDDAIVPSAWKKDLFDLLRKIRAGGKLDEKDKKLAGKLYDQIN